MFLIQFVCMSALNSETKLAEGIKLGMQDPQKYALHVGYLADEATLY